MTSPQKTPRVIHDYIIRGYIFVNTDNPGSAAKEIWGLNSKLSLDPFDEQIMRADTLEDPAPYDIVVTIYAPTTNKFDAIFSVIEGKFGEGNVTKAIVSQNNTYNPYPPHKTIGYVTNNDKNADPAGPDPGPQDHNVWG